MSETHNVKSVDEDAFCDCVSANRLNLQRFLDEFVETVQLFELLERGGGPPSVGVFGGVFIKFRIIAAKQGALSLFHFKNSLEALREYIYRCPRTRYVDGKKLREAKSLFDRYFPNADNTRNAVAHAGEIYKSPAAIRQHEQKQDYRGIGVFSAAGGLSIQSLYERTYAIGWIGQVFEVHMDTSSIQKLAEVLNIVEEAFIKAEAGTSGAPPPSGS
ncbi:hypothetical protein [Bosea caraganae]|uniref:hypothetical protein n=1 Tax=Bosea caraganae TaxID=2763117 RepID=UPI0011C059A3|nr:hypothetical protein [Bosea caraganae]